MPIGTWWTVPSGWVIRCRKKSTRSWNDSFYQQQQLSRSETLSHRKDHGYRVRFPDRTSTLCLGLSGFSPHRQKRICSYMNCWCVISADRSYNSLIDSLEYLDRMGVTAIELMPIMEYEGNDSWVITQVILRHWINTTVPVKPSRPLWTVATHEVLPSS